MADSFNFLNDISKQKLEQHKQALHTLCKKQNKTLNSIVELHNIKHKDFLAKINNKDYNIECKTDSYISDNIVLELLTNIPIENLPPHISQNKTSRIAKTNILEYEWLLCIIKLYQDAYEDKLGLILCNNPDTLLSYYYEEQGIFYYYKIEKLYDYITNNLESKMWDIIITKTCRGCCWCNVSLLIPRQELDSLLLGSLNQQLI